MSNIRPRDCVWKYCPFGIIGLGAGKRCVPDIRTSSVPLLFHTSEPSRIGYLIFTPGSVSKNTVPWAIFLNTLPREQEEDVCLIYLP